METIPKSVRIGSALGLLGGVAAVASMAVFFRAEDGALLDMGACMLAAVLFFALAGGLSKGGLWSWNVLLLMTFLTIGVAGSLVIVGAIDAYVGVFLAAIGALIAASLIAPASRNWADRIRF
ncbi:MAG: hypothetical protein FWH47_06710 [Methanomassiliicoccaceae archaeon]|nr:hypothetical protein [Methanomassiliicoccaceae archaeon]